MSKKIKLEDLLKENYSGTMAGGIVSRSPFHNNISLSKIVKEKYGDTDGETVDVKKYWPHSFDNLDPYDSVDIGFTITKDKSAVDVEVKVISVRIWQ